MAKQTYVCEYCRALFDSMENAELHEKVCGNNPINKVNDKMLLRLSMIYETLDNIIACAINAVDGERIDCLQKELQRANEKNCFYAIFRHKDNMLRNLRAAPQVRRKQDGRKSSTYRDVEKENPELIQAFITTLERRAWNER